MAMLLEPGMVSQGHIFVPRKEGGRYVEVRLASDAYESQSELDGRGGGRHTITGSGQAGFIELRFDFALTLPDGLFDYEGFEPDRIYSGQDLPDLGTDAFRAQLENLPCCATNEAGDRNGDPLNIALVGDFPDVMYALARSGSRPDARILPAQLAGGGIRELVRIRPGQPAGERRSAGGEPDQRPLLQRWFAIGRGPVTSSAALHRGARPVVGGVERPRCRRPDGSSQPQRLAHR